MNKKLLIFHYLNIFYGTEKKDTLIEELYESSSIINSEDLDLKYVFIKIKNFIEKKTSFLSKEQTNKDTFINLKKDLINFIINDYKDIKKKDTLALDVIEEIDASSDEENEISKISKKPHIKNISYIKNNNLSNEKFNKNLEANKIEQFLTLLSFNIDTQIDIIELDEEFCDISNNEYEMVSLTEIETYLVDLIQGGIYTLYNSSYELLHIKKDRESTISNGKFKDKVDDLQSFIGKNVEKLLSSSPLIYENIDVQKYLLYQNNKIEKYFSCSNIDKLGTEFIDNVKSPYVKSKELKEKVGKDSYEDEKSFDYISQIKYSNLKNIEYRELKEKVGKEKIEKGSYVDEDSYEHYQSFDFYMSEFKSSYGKNIESKEEIDKKEEEDLGNPYKKIKE